MAVRMSGEYAGNLKVKLVHGPSAAEIATAAPVDNHGDGSSFSPTDLAAVSLGTCMLTVMAIAARKEGVEMDGARFELEKHMSAEPRRIDRIPVTVHMPGGLTAEQRARLEHIALDCPVMHSLSERIDKDVRFVYPD